MKEKVILVDENDQEIGEMGKMEAHKKAFLHRAVSVFIFNSKNELLLQKRANNKYHSGNLWTNTCCSHPKPGENTLDAAKRRLYEEMNLNTELEYVHRFTYHTKFENGITEKEIDHVFIGFSDDVPILNPQEASEFKYMNISDISNAISMYPKEFTSWFKICFEDVKLELLTIKNVQ